MRRSALIGVLLATLATAGSAIADDGPAPPAPCNGVPQIADVAGDGHHSSTDVLSAWLSEAHGTLQAVIGVRAGTFVPEHSDAEINGSGFALVFGLGGQADYVRLRAAPDGSLAYDYGTYAGGGAFTSAGATTGSVVHSAGAGTVTIDVPAALGAAPGTVLSAPYVLTYDGITAGTPGWVDHAPGGEDPADPARGGDYIVGACGGAAGPGPGAGAGPGSGAGKTTAVLVSVPSRLVGRGRVLIAGQVIPPRAGVRVTITRSARATRVSRVTTDAEGSFAAVASVSESTRVRAEAEGVHSGTQSIDVHSRTTLRRLRSGALRGSVTPALPGRALLLRTGSPTVLASGTVSHGRFSFRRRLERGAYQVVYEPAATRAERSTSNTVRVP